MKNRTLFFGDNLEVLRKKSPDETFDLIYLDPPFNSNRNYNVIFKEGLQDSSAQIHAFEDSWHWAEDSRDTFNYLVTQTNENIANLMLAFEKMVDHNDMLAYLTMMTIRLIELHRVLKKTGSIYLHCDPTASHYLKIVLDAIFGKQNFRNEIVWKRGHSFKHSGYQFPRVHDVILFYSKSDSVTFNKIFIDYEAGTLVNYSYDDNDGRGKYRLQALRTYGKETIEKLEKENRIYATSSGKKWLKQYLSEKEGKSIDDFWGDIRSMEVMRKEQLGYPTQKPEALLERIIKASSKDGDWILDPFCGCGTTVAVSEKLGRNWVGIDVTALSINLIKHRLEKQFNLGSKQMVVDGFPTDMAGAKELFKKDPFQFEFWALDLIDAIPAQNKSEGNMRGADKGIDGIINIIKGMRNDRSFEFGKVLVQVKGGGVQRHDIATLKGDVDREKADGGVFITLEEPTKSMILETVDAGTFTTPLTNKFEFPKIQILTVKELLEGKKLNLPKGMVTPYYKEAGRAEIDNSGDQAQLGL